MASEIIPQESLENTFGSNVFSEAVMRARLPKATFKALKKTIDEGLPLDPSVADIVANTMKDWAIEKGATHFTHWFQPMTGITAEKHDSFISPTSDGKIIVEFSGKELIKGEPDASSFPSGGLRSTFEARGYTAWDCTSPAFYKNNTLYIPTAFCSYTGEALDKKTPLLRSMQALSKQAVRILRAFGNTTATKVTTTVGPEQEYFVIDKKLYEKRKDLILTGRTLFGSKPPKGQELEDHYFGILKERIAAFMLEVDQELWKLGVLSKTKHNEVAPAQHELAPIFTTTNIATDHNQLVMETLKKVANRHGLVALLHEKPFAGVNGSGKHNNWSMASNDGQNLLEPGKTPHDNEQFLVFLAAVLEAVDEYADVLRVSAANPGNDHRLGANEAPPAIISIFLGEQLADVFNQLKKGKAKSSKSGGTMHLGVDTLPVLMKDAGDRNRTSPFAFTGNKFEFRAVASNQSIAAPLAALNTIMAESLDYVATKLEKAPTAKLNDAVQDLLTEIAKEHSAIIFNGNGYSEEWHKEAAKRGLPNLKTSVDCIPVIAAKGTVAAYEAYGILTKRDLEARRDIAFEQYVKSVNVEDNIVAEMVATKYVPAAVRYQTELAENVAALKAAGVKPDTGLLDKISALITSLGDEADKLTELRTHHVSGLEAEASHYCHEVLPQLLAIRKVVDALEAICPDDSWPVPTYEEMLFIR